MREIVSFEKEIPFKTMISSIASISLEHTLALDNISEISGDFIVSGTYKMTAASQIEETFSYKIPVDISLDDKYDLEDLIIDIDDFTYEVVNEQILTVKIDLLLDKLKIKEEPVEVLNLSEEAKEAEMDDVIGEAETGSDRKELDIIEEERSDTDLVNGDDLFLEFDSKVDLFSDDSKDINTKEEAIISDIQNNLKNNIDSSIKDSNKENINLVDDNVEVNIVNDNTPEVEDTMDKESLFASFDTSRETYATYNVYIVRENDSIEEIIMKYKITREQFDEYNNASDVKVGSKVIIPCANE